jgi:polyisoprenyl-phosphate glycosyltransferase
MNNPEKISVVFSVFNESESLPSLFIEVLQLEKGCEKTFEWIFVEDGSTDNSAEIIRKFCHTYNHRKNTVRLIRFSRNFGHEAAMIAGIDHATGDAVICLDADLQHPVTLIPMMIETHGQGYDIINMVRNSNEGTKALQSWLSGAFYRMLNRISNQKIAESASDFFLVSKPVANILRENYRERNRFLRGLIQTIGFRSTTIGFTAPARIAGETKYSLLKLVTLTAHAITSFSKTPLFLGIWFGFFFALISLGLGVYTIWVYLFGTTPPSGYTTIVLFMSFSFSILFFLIGIIGVYVGYLFDEQKKRPIYLVEELI